MYSMRSFCNDLTNIELPTCMYRMKPLTLLHEEKDQNLEELFQRQEAVLERLEILKKKMSGLFGKFSVDNYSVRNEIKDTTKVQLQIKKPQMEAFQSSACEDFVIRANPDDPPTSLLILKSFLMEKENMFFKSFVHSSIKEISEKQKLTSDDCGIRSEYKYGLTLIWENCEGTPCLIESPVKGIHILGEFVIARYLARVISPALFESLDFELTCQIDDLLDLASSFMAIGCPGAKELLARLDRNLSSNTWLVGNSLSLADVALWSVLSSKRKAFGKLPKSVDTWYNTCSALPQFKNVQ